MSTSVPSIDVMMTAPRNRASMQSSMTVGSAAAGTAMTARLTSAGTSCSRATEATADGVVGRVDREDLALGGRRDVRPQGMTHPTALVAGPDTAIVRGRRSRVMARSRRLLPTLDGVAELLGLLEGEVEIDDAALEAPLDRPPGSAEHGEHRSVVGEHLGREAHDAVGPGDRGQVLEQSVAMPLPWWASSTWNAASASSRPAQRS